MPKTDVICISSDDEDEPPPSQPRKRAKLRAAAPAASSSSEETVVLSVDSDDEGAPQRSSAASSSAAPDATASADPSAGAPGASSAPAISSVASASGAGSGAAGFAIDLCDDDEDGGGSLFASQLNMLFDDDEVLSMAVDVGIGPSASAPFSMSTKEAARAVPQLGRAGSSSATSGASSGGASAPIELDDDDDECAADAATPPPADDEDADAAMAARLQAQIDAEEAAEAQRRSAFQEDDEVLARRVQERLASDIAASVDDATGPPDLLLAQRNRVREWLQKNASQLNVKDVWSNPAAMPGGHLYQRFATAFATASDKAVRLVFHGTREENIDHICEHGLDPSRRGVNGQALGAGEYFAERPDISLPYCAVLVFAVIMDRAGLTNRQQGIVVINKPDHQLPMFVISFEHHHHKQALAMLRSSGLPPGLAGRLAASASSLAGRLGGQPTSTALYNQLAKLLPPQVRHRVSPPAAKATAPPKAAASKAKGKARARGGRR